MPKHENEEQSPLVSSDKHHSNSRNASPPSQQQPSVIPWSSAAQQQQRRHGQKKKLDMDKDYSYVKFPSRRGGSPLGHEYSYPKLGSLTTTESKKQDDSSFLKRRDSISSLKRSTSPPTQSSSQSFFHSSIPRLSGLQKTSGSGSSSQSFAGSRGLVAAANHEVNIANDPNISVGSVICVYCRKSFIPDGQSDVRRCRNHPHDKVRDFIETATFVRCAKCLLLHCTSDQTTTNQNSPSRSRTSEDDEFDEEDPHLHPCSCSNKDGKLFRRWLALGLLSVLLPCLCCYWPMLACYEVGVACGICGGTHETHLEGKFRKK